jgi:hypothetical protein
LIIRREGLRSGGLRYEVFYIILSFRECFFNVTGLCIPEKHYMVDISEKVHQIVAMVEKGQYFTINHAKQYGKTTTIRQLEKCLDFCTTRLRICDSF